MAVRTAMIPGLPPAPAPGVDAEPLARPLSQVLSDLAGDESRDRIAVGDLLTMLPDRALAAMLLVFALPNVLPAPPGLSAVLGTPLLFLAAQLAFGLPPWLPRLIAERSMARTHFASVVGRAVPWLARAERLLRPRLGVLARPPLEHVVGLVCLMLALILFLPIPLGNMLPALAICLLALGVLERDGVWILAGLLTAIASVTVVWGVLYALIRSALFILANAFS
jgi:hypothetical protein